MHVTWNVPKENSGSHEKFLEYNISHSTHNSIWNLNTDPFVGIEKQAHFLHRYFVVQCEQLHHFLGLTLINTKQTHQAKDHPPVPPPSTSNFHVQLHFVTVQAWSELQVLVDMHQSYQVKPFKGHTLCWYSLWRKWSSPIQECVICLKCLNRRQWSIATLYYYSKATQRCRITRLGKDKLTSSYNVRLETISLATVTKSCKLSADRGLITKSWKCHHIMRNWLLNSLRTRTPSQRKWRYLTVGLWKNCSGGRMRDILRY